MICVRKAGWNLTHLNHPAPATAAEIYLEFGSSLKNLELCPGTAVTTRLLP